MTARSTSNPQSPYLEETKDDVQILDAQGLNENGCLNDKKQDWGKVCKVCDRKFILKGAVSANIALAQQFAKATEEMRQ